MNPSVLFLIDTLQSRGGTEMHLRELATRMEGCGYHPIVCCLGGDEPVLQDMAAAGVETWPHRVVRLYTPEGQRTASSIAAEAATRNVRAVQAFHFKSDWMGVGIARALHCPLISSRRDLGFAQTSLRRIVYKSVNRHVQAFITPSEAVKRAVMAREGVPSERVHVIYNGVERERFETSFDRAETRAWLGMPDTGPVIGMVSGLRPIKDHRTLLRAMRRIADARPDAHLALVGEGTEEEALRAFTAGLGLERRVTFTGAREDIPRVLAALDVFVLSSHSEGMSNAILEAMAAGRPVVATDVGGNAECVVHGETGYVTPPGNDAALAERLLNLLDHPQVAATMGAAGHARIVDLFDIGGMVRRHADLYNALLAPARKERLRAV